jgi:hypothetical protein
MDVQAHAQNAAQPGPSGEINTGTGDGQLLAVRIPGS